ncbi:MAG: hypothetical protein ACRYGO_05020 [Janthinobacterium lividum]
MIRAFGSGREWLNDVDQVRRSIARNRTARKLRRFSLIRQGTEFHSKSLTVSREACQHGRPPAYEISFQKSAVNEILFHSGKHSAAPSLPFATVAKLDTRSPNSIAYGLNALIRQGFMVQARGLLIKNLTSHNT